MASAEAVAEYKGSCHCQAICYSVELPSLFSQLETISCDCSYCRISGSLLTFVDGIKFYQGGEVLKEYRFGSHTIQIFFCGACGANVYNRSINPKWRYGKIALNVRLLHDVDPEMVKITKVHGRNVQLPPLAENST
ncbi:Mss4-like protein [Aspergillus cavernicola]|uniref:Mss4-like protein n=1 Tax=Aspergillus cavernicola TaxID=176166 RepID=A0ABR4IB07_9EURO